MARRRSSYTSSSDYSVEGGGVGLLGLLTLVFITLKLTGNIDWSWWWILSPIWIPVALVLLILLIVILVVCVATLLNIDKDN